MSDEQKMAKLYDYINQAADAGHLEDLRLAFAKAYADSQKRRLNKKGATTYEMDRHANCPAQANVL